MKVYDQSGQMYELDQEIASGGQGRILKVKDDQQVLAKIYHQPTNQQEQKLLAMMAKGKQQTPQIPVAWPKVLLYEKSGLLRQKEFVGFLMPHVTAIGTLYSMYQPTERKKHNYAVTKEHLYVIAHNLAYVVATIHQWGYVLGDINESNFMVDTNLFVTLVDADSLQFNASGLATYRCLVAKPEYTPPELGGADLSLTDRSEVHDRFGLAVLLFYLLMNGRYPYTGVLTTATDIPRVGLHCKQQGLFPYVKNDTVVPPPNAPPFQALPPEVQGAFIRSFKYGYFNPEKRPSATEWQKILWRARRKLTVCVNNPAHVYSSHLDTCPWCS